MAQQTADLVFVTNIPTPYRTAFFNTLAMACEAEGLGLAVLYCARTEPRRDWDFHPDENRYKFSFPAGIAPTVRDVTLPINPGVNLNLAALKPRVVIHAGAWNMPSNLISLFGPRGDRATRLFWSEGHADAVRNAEGPVARLRRRVLQRFDGFVVPNGKSAAWLAHEGLGDRPVHVLPNTVDEQFYSIDRSMHQPRIDARAALGIGQEERVLVQVAALVARKGPVELATAFAQLPKAVRHNARLVFVGEGELRGQVAAIGEGLDAGSITITGNIQRDGVRQWLSAADGFALNTRVDPNPLSPLEASFAGLPLLLSRRAGNFEEIVGELATGFAIDDPASPDRALADFFAAPADMLAACGARAQANAHAHFTRAAIARALLVSLGLARG